MLHAATPHVEKFAANPAAFSVRFIPSPEARSVMLVMHAAVDTAVELALVELDQLETALRTASEERSSLELMNSGAELGVARVGDALAVRVLAPPLQVAFAMPAAQLDAFIAQMREAEKLARRDTQPAAAAAEPA